MLLASCDICFYIFFILHCRLFRKTKGAIYEFLNAIPSCAIC